MSNMDKLFFMFFFVGVIACLTFSTIFHIIMCHSCVVYETSLRLDFLGIVMLMMGSAIPSFYFAFYCEFYVKFCYIAIALICGIITIILTKHEHFHKSDYHIHRTTIFAGFGALFFAPSIHYFIEKGFYNAIQETSIQCLFYQAIFYLLSGLVYVTKFPECIFPGKCDTFFQSHQIFHLFVICAAYAYFYGLSDMTMHLFMNKVTCPTT